MCPADILFDLCPQDPECLLFEATGQDLLQQMLAEGSWATSHGTSTVLPAFLSGIGPLAPKQKMGGREPSRPVTPCIVQLGHLGHSEGTG